MRHISVTMGPEEFSRFMCNIGTMTEAEMKATLTDLLETFDTISAYLPGKQHILINEPLGRLFDLVEPNGADTKNV